MLSNEIFQKHLWHDTALYLQERNIKHLNALSAADNVLKCLCLYGKTRVMLFNSAAAVLFRCPWWLHKMSLADNSRWYLLKFYSVLFIKGTLDMIMPTLKIS